MKKELITAVLSSMLAAPASPYVIIENSPGGYIEDFAQKRHDYERAGVEVRIKGWCASACVIYSGMKNFCVMPGSYFAFHQGYEPPTYTRGWATSYMLRNMNRKFRQAIEDSGEELPTFGSGKYLYIFAEDAVRLGWVRAC